MNKVWLIIQREFLNRVQKKSFLIATILVPLIIPAIMGGAIAILVKEAETAKPDKLHVLDESGAFKLETTKRFTIIPVTGSLETAKAAYTQTDDFGLLYIPMTEINDPKGITIFTKESQSLENSGASKPCSTILLKMQKWRSTM